MCRTIQDNNRKQKKLTKPIDQESKYHINLKKDLTMQEIKKT